MASWNSVLEGYARQKDPRASIPSGVFLSSDDHTLTIFDGYEKAKYHFLVMRASNNSLSSKLEEPPELNFTYALSAPARDPFNLSPTKDALVTSKVPSKDLVSLSALLKSPHALEVLTALKTSSEKVKKMIEDEMLKEDGWVWGCSIGFHASESMRHVHLHVISTPPSDLISPKLKNKKHYNSFHPKLGFFLHLDEVIAQVQEGSVPKASPSFYETILKEPLVSIYTGEEFKNIPKLKEHLEAEFEGRGRKAKAKLGDNQKRPASGLLEGGGEPKKTKP
ncbi:aprataxin, partial [Phenoliferia sp. Uapishka_3]